MRALLYIACSDQKKNPYIWRNLSDAGDAVVFLQEFPSLSGWLGWKSKNESLAFLCPLTIPLLMSLTRYKSVPESWKKIWASGSDGGCRAKGETEKY